jgi:peroxiredoxin
MALKRRRLAPAVALCGLAVLAALLADPATRDRLHRAAYAMGIRRPVPTIAVGRPVPALQLQSLRGAAVTIGGAASRGVVVYNVFTSWCPACKQEASGFGRVAAHLRRHGVRFVGIDQGESAVQAAAFAREHGLGYRVLLDPGGITTSLLGARAIPKTLVVRNGRIAAILVGPVTEAQLERAVEGG